MSRQYTAIIDVDTLLIHAALAGQETNVIVIHKDTGWKKEFKNQTEFFGHHTKKEGGWLGDLNKSREVKVSPNDFEIETVTKKIEDIVENGKVISAEAVVKGRFKNKIETITSQPWCKDFKICYGTGKNFRYGIAETAPYKESRPVKPLLYEEVRDYMLWKYKDYMQIVDGVETDEIVTQNIWEAWIRSGRNHNNLDSVAVFIDKDLEQFPCLQYNFDKPELGLIKITALDAIKNLAIQMLKGDSIDTVPGLPRLTDELHKKYEIRKSGKGLGDKTARSLIEPMQTPREVFERVVEAYRAFYGDDKKPFTSFRGDVTERNWLDHMNEQFRLLRMRTDVTKDVGHVSKFLDALGVCYE